MCADDLRQSRRTFARKEEEKYWFDRLTENPMTAQPHGLTILYPFLRKLLQTLRAPCPIIPIIPRVESLRRTPDSPNNNTAAERPCPDTRALCSLASWSMGTRDGLFDRLWMFGNMFLPPFPERRAPRLFVYPR